jgi:hypothetical protein
MQVTKTQGVFRQCSWPKNDVAVSQIILDMTVDKILQKTKLNRSYDIPYLAGYSRDAKTIYIDRHMPTYFIIGDKTVMVDRYLILHEAVEKALIDHLGLCYQFAHQIALRTEQAAVRSDGVRWSDYDRFMQKYIKEIGSKKPIRVPRNLDIRPYRAEHDRRLLKAIKKFLSKERKDLSKSSR